MITRQRPATLVPVQRSPVRLEARDLEILRRLSEGAAGETIAAELGLPARTLQRRISEIKARLGARSTIAAVVVAIRQGLI